jgi:hypothetical protein
MRDTNTITGTVLATTESSNNFKSLLSLPYLWVMVKAI